MADQREVPERAKLSMERGPVSQLELTDEDLAGLSASQTMATHKKAAFLRAFAIRGIVLEGVTAAGVSRKTIGYWRDTDDWFEALYQAALDEAGDRLEQEAMRRAVDGVDVPVIYQGMPTMVEDAQTGEKRMLTTKQYSDPLLALLLKGRKQEYRENVKQTHAFEGQTGVLVVPAPVDPDAWAKAAQAQQAQYAGSTGEDSGVK
jgi:hypothetical protein